MENNLNHKKKILYIGWLGFHNLGDELMWDLFKEKFNEIANGQPWELVSTIRQSCKRYNVDTLDLVILGGGSIFWEEAINYLYDAIKKGKKVIIWGTGIDFIDDKDIPLLEKGQSINLNKYFSKNFCKKLVEIVENAVFAGVRGPLTFEIMKQIGVNQEKLILSGDPGLLLTKGKPVSKVPEFKDNKIIGVNWGTTPNWLYGGNEKKVEDQLVDAIHSLIKKGYKFYLYPVWDRDIAPLKQLYLKINDPDNTILDTELHHQQYLFDLISNFYFTINFKLHANVISAAAEIPFIPLAYRFKVFDFTQSVKLNPLIIPTSSPTLTEDILNMEQYINTERNMIIENIREMKLEYIDRIKKPFDQQLYLK